MKVLYFGTYDRYNPRNQILIDGLRLNGIEVKECNYPVFHSTAEKVATVENIKQIWKILLCFLKAFFILPIKYFRSAPFDVIVVGYTGQFDIPLARILTWISRKPLVLDAFLSVYETALIDRKISAPRVTHIFLYWSDKLACSLSDCVLIDTHEHAEYFRELFKLSKDNFIEIPTGADEDIFKPLPLLPLKDKLVITYFGTYLPLHGCEYIVRAAKELESHENIKFIMIGQGSEYESIQQLVHGLDVHNIQFIGWVDRRVLRNFIRNSHICLGSFGDTEKARHVVPTKVYETLALRRVILTGRTPCIERLLKNTQSGLICSMANSSDLAETILWAFQNPHKCEDISNRGYKLFQERFTKYQLGRQLKGELEKLIKKTK